MESMRKQAFVIALVFSIASVASAQTKVDAKQKYQQMCAICHGADGKSQTTMGKNVGAVDLTTAKTQSMSDADLTTVIEKGKGKMPAYGNVLGKDGTAAMLKYVRAMKAAK